MNDCRDFDLLVARAFSLGHHFLRVPVSLLWVLLAGMGCLVMVLCIIFEPRPLVFSKWGEDGGMIGWGLGRLRFSFPSALRRKMVSGTSHLGFHRTMHLIVGVGVRSPYGLPAEFLLCFVPLPVSGLEIGDYSSRLAVWRIVC